MPTNVDVPSLGESVTEAVLLRWLKKEGEPVTKDEPLAELETDKANVELPAPAAGVLRRAKEEGDTIHVGETIARVDEGGAGAAPAPTQSGAGAKAAPSSKPAAPPPAPQKPDKPAPAATTKSQTEDLRPSVRRLVEENKLDPAAIKATGPGGMLTKEDVLAHLESRGQVAATAVAEEEEQDDTEPDRRPPSARGGAPRSTEPVSQPGAVAASRPLAPSPAVATADGYDATGIKRVPMSKIRKRIAQNLVQAQQTAAILTTFNEVDLSSVMALRSKFKERFQEVYGVGLGFMSFFARAVVLALREFPRVNARLEGDDIVYHNFVHLGIAVSTDRGLAVPVLRNAEQMSFARVESEIKRLAAGARDGKLGIQELSGGTFTITNGGIFGSLLSTPILNPPQSGILGMHAIKDRPVALQGKVEIRPMMYLALSYDHRVVDGRESVSFLVRVKEYLEDPARLMLEI